MIGNDRIYHNWSWKSFHSSVEDQSSYLWVIDCTFKIKRHYYTLDWGADCSWPRSYIIKFIYATIGKYSFCIWNQFVDRWWFWEIFNWTCRYCTIETEILWSKGGSRKNGVWCIGANIWYCCPVTAQLKVMVDFSGPRSINLQTLVYAITVGKRTCCWIIYIEEDRSFSEA